MDEPLGFWHEAFGKLRARPQFIVAVALIVLVLVVAAFPGLFTGADPSYADPNQSLRGPSAQHWFGTDLQGHEIYARTIYGARASITVGIGPTLAVLAVGATLGALAGFYGGWLDAVGARLAGIFLAIPLLVAGIAVMS